MTKLHRSRRRLSATSERPPHEMRACVVPPIDRLERRTLLAGFHFPGRQYDVGDSPRSVVSADLDGDGDLDLVTANLGSNNISVLRSNGDGTFEAAVSYALGNQPWSVRAGDLDGDGDADLVTANTNAGQLSQVSVLLNNGDATFAAR